MPMAPVLAGNRASMTTRKCSGLRMTTASPAGDRAWASSNLTVMEIADWPGTSRRLLATDGCGGESSRWTAAAGAPPAGAAPTGSDCSTRAKGSVAAGAGSAMASGT
jgi:hypothetical protein